MLKKFNKSSPKILLTHTPKFFYESIWIRFFKYFKKSNINSNSVYHDDLNKSSSLSEQLPFQYKMDETKPKTITPMIVLEAQLRTIEEQKEISEIESLRMKEIDKMLGTNTYFHEVQDNEERLSSEFVMERKALKDFAEQESFTDVLVNIDPQQRLSMPKIRNFNDFAKKAFEMRTYPKHLKETSIFTNRFESLLDPYKYLELNPNAEMFENKMNLIATNQDFKKLMDFLGQELLYTNYSMTRMQRIEDKISKEYFGIMSSFNIQPLHYDNWVYFTKDPNLNSQSIFDIYRVPVQRNNQDEHLIKVTDISPSIEECVLSKQEIIDYLNLNFPQNEEVSHFIKGITNYRQSSIYKEFSFDKDHKLMAIVLDLSTPLTLFKDVSSGKFCKSFLKGIDEVVLDQKGGVYYIRVNGLERKCFLMHHKINEFDQNGNIQENCVYEESEINYELKVKRGSNYEFGFLICQKIGGSSSNEIGLINLKQNTKIEIQRTFDRKQEIFWILKLNEEAFYFMEKNKKKIYRIFRNPDAQTLSLINQNLSKSLSAEITPKTNLISANSQINPIENTKIQEKYLVESFQQKEKYEIFFEAKENEELKNFEVFKHYVLIELISDRKEFFKVYNCKNKSFHTMLISEPLFEVNKGVLQHYDSQFFLFNLSTPHLPTKLMSYNMALREFSLLFSDTYPGIDLLNYTIERVEAISRDGIQIPVSFMYNKFKVNENSVVLLHAEYYHNKTTKREFQPEIVSLLDRGFIYAFPHIRGSFDINEQWLEQGSGIKRLTMISDFIDTGAFILKNEISKRVFALGVNSLGGLCAIVSVLKEPKVFSACAIHNGIFDVLDFLETNPDKEETKKMFGDFEDKDIYEFIKSYSPYHLKKIVLKNTLITSDIRNERSGSSRKFIAKIRENEANKDVYYKEFSYKDLEKEKFFFQSAFLTEQAFNKK